MWRSKQIIRQFKATYNSNNDNNKQNQGEKKNNSNSPYSNTIKQTTNNNSRHYKQASLQRSPYKILQDQSKTRPNISSKVYIQNLPTITQTLKTSQSLYHLAQRIEQYQKHTTHQFQQLQNELKNDQNNLTKNMKQCEQNMQRILLDLQQFHSSVVYKTKGKGYSINGSSVRGSNGNATDRVSGKFQDSNGMRLSAVGANTIIDKLTQTQLQKQSLEYIKSQKIAPQFQLLHSQTIQSQSHTKNHLTQCQKKLSTLSPQLSTEQKQSQQNLLKLVNISNQYIQQLQLSLLEENRISDERLCMMEDKVQVIQAGLIDMYERTCQARKREDKIIQQIVEKMIYKMSLL